MTSELPRSQLPGDPEFWEGLARRIRTDAVGPLAAYCAIQDRWDRVLARSAPWLVAACAAAMLVLWLALPARDSIAARWIERSLGPDELAGVLVAGPEPPTVDVLMAQFAPAMNGETPR